MNLVEITRDCGLLDTGRLADVILYEICSQVSCFCEQEKNNEIIMDLLNQSILDCDDPQISRAFDVTTMVGSRELFLYLSEEQVPLSEFMTHAQYEEFPFTHLCMVNKNEFLFFTMEDISKFVEVAKWYLIDNLKREVLDKIFVGLDYEY